MNVKVQRTIVQARQKKGGPKISIVHTVVLIALDVLLKKRFISAPIKNVCTVTEGNAVNVNPHVKSNYARQLNTTQTVIVPILMGSQINVRPQNAIMTKNRQPRFSYCLRILNYSEAMWNKISNMTYDQF